ncbi:ATP synthase mitochondrial F1 complex assembly factor 1 isoform X1 [Huso huso]|nr:ATP synthase mitochondrial F1 complex assembly factor 1 isoform X1 [Acipenser ruthenus]
MSDRVESKMAAAMVHMCCLYRGMLAVRNTGIRPLIPGVAPLQLRAFSVRKEPTLEENPFYSKYGDKIAQLRRLKPQEFEACIEKRRELKRQPLGQSQQAEFIKLIEEESEKLGKRASGSGGFSKDKTLGSILNVDMVKEKTAEEIGQIWMHYFATKDTICAIIPGEKFETMSDRGKNCPTFLYALPQEEGYEFFVGQWSGNELHFTSLINVQTIGQNAPSQLILYHYPELQKDKGIVLMAAEMDHKFLDVTKAQCLANQVQLFYGTQHQETFHLVELFNHKPADFKHMSVIAKLEQTGISHPRA